jgi:hypothetical protein
LKKIEFEFKCGDMDWESELNYTFIQVKNNKTISGTVYGVDSENQISQLKENFIRNSK